MKRAISLILLLCMLALTGCDSAMLTLSDPDLDSAVRKMFEAIVAGDTQAQEQLFRSDAVYQEGVSVSGEVLDVQPLSRSVDIQDGRTQKDARYQIETKSGDKYVVLVRYIIDDAEDGFYQYTIAKK